jgi:hypothetical protein
MNNSRWRGPLDPTKPSAPGNKQPNSAETVSLVCENGKRDAQKQGLAPLGACLPHLEAKNASQAIPATSPAIPVSLVKEIRRANMVYKEVWRSGQVAVYRAEGEGRRVEYEVFEVQILPAEQVGDRSYSIRESVPSNSSWGESAWTFTNNSHHDPLAAAMAKAHRLASKQFPRGVQANPKAALMIPSESIQALVRGSSGTLSRKKHINNE